MSCSGLLFPQVTTILQHFQKVQMKEEARYRSQQLLAVAKRWTAPMDSLLATYMPHACVVVSVLKEVALYAGVQQVRRRPLADGERSLAGRCELRFSALQSVLLTAASRKCCELLPVLALSADAGHKTVVVTSCAQEAQEVFQVGPRVAASAP